MTWQRLGSRLGDAIPLQGSLSGKLIFVARRSNDALKVGKGIVDDDADLRYSLKRVLGGKDYDILEASGELGLKIAAGKAAGDPLRQSDAWDNGYQTCSTCVERIQMP